MSRTGVGRVTIYDTVDGVPAPYGSLVFKLGATAPPDIDSLPEADRGSYDGTTEVTPQGWSSSPVSDPVLHTWVAAAKYAITSIADNTWERTDAGWSAPIQFNGKDGGTYEAEFSVSGLTGTWHSDYDDGDHYRRERIKTPDDSETWSAAVKINPIKNVDYSDGASAIGVYEIYEYSIDGVSNWHSDFMDADIYRRTAVVVDGSMSDFSDAARIMGADGIAGVNGSDGNTSYLHIAYANTADGSGGFSTTNQEDKLYLGQYVDFTLEDSLDHTDYSWTRIRGIDGINGLDGSDGAQGIQGVAGTNGDTSYFHLAYADAVDGTGFSQNPADKDYIGTYADFTSADSTDPADYTWTLIKGAQGDTGDQGIAGVNGIDGNTTYLHIAYANDINGTGLNQTAGTYIGTYTDFIATDSVDPNDYNWVLIKGADGIDGADGVDGLDGAQGIQGISGTDGQTSYFHIAYADDNTGSGFSQDPANKDYIGTYSDFTAADSNDPTDYTWILAKGAQGETGSQGIAGTNGTNGLTSYLHIAYASDATGSDFSQTTGTYIGQYVDQTEADSNDPTQYTWTLIKGDQGIAGPVGDNGLTTYFHVAYADDVIGNGFSQSAADKFYMGTYVDYVEADSNDPNDYSWTLIQGTDGLNGGNYEYQWSVAGIDPWYDDYAKGYYYRRHRLVSDTETGDWSNAEQVIPVKDLDYSDGISPPTVYEVYEYSEKGDEVGYEDQWHTDYLDADIYRRTGFVLDGVLSDWSAASKITGLDGRQAASITLYQMSPTTPLVPQGDVTFSFVDGTVTGALGDWTLESPENLSAGGKIWSTHNTALGLGSDIDDVLDSGDWSAPQSIIVNGLDGNHGTGSYIVILAATVEKATVQGYSDATIDAIFAGAAVADRAPQNKDIISFVNDTHADEEKRFKVSFLYDGSTWEMFVSVIDGSQIVHGTLAAEAIQAGTITGDKIDSNTIITGHIDAKSLTFVTSIPEEIDNTNVDKTSVGLGNVDNTSDATAQTATITAAKNDAALANSSVTLGSDGTLSGAGGGQVTVAGIGAETPQEAQNKANTAEQNAKDYADGAFVTTTLYAQDMTTIQNQIDKSITTWFYDGVPDNTNAPENTWSTDDERNVHLGDIYYDNLTGYAYRYQLAASVYSWVKLTDSDLTAALATASAAKDTADSKRRVFVATPVVPYDEGDLWDTGSGIKRCTYTLGRDIEDSYESTDWSLITDPEGSAATAESNAKAYALAQNNLLADSGFQGTPDLVTGQLMAFPRLWNPAIFNGTLTCSARSAGDSWGLNYGGLTGELNQTAPVGSSSIDYVSIHGDDVPVEEGQRLCFSVYTGAHRCKVQARIQFRDENKAYMSGVVIYSSDVNDEEAAGGDDLVNYKRLICIGDIPTGARYAYAEINKYDTKTGYTDSFLFFVKPMFSFIAAGSNDVPDFSVSSSGTDKILSRLGASYVDEDSIQIKSDNFVSGSSGWAIDSAGNSEFSNVTVRGDITAETGHIKGNITVGNTIDASNYLQLRGANSTGSTNTGIYVVKDGAGRFRLDMDGRMRIYNGGTTYMDINPNTGTATFEGTVKADKIIGDIVSAVSFVTAPVERNGLATGSTLFKRINIVNARPYDRTLTFNLLLQVRCKASSNQDADVTGCIKVTGDYGTIESSSLYIESSDSKLETAELVCSFAIPIGANTTGYIDVNTHTLDAGGVGTTRIVSVKTPTTNNTWSAQLFQNGSDLS